jgi:hypothetical protein
MIVYVDIHVYESESTRPIYKNITALIIISNNMILYISLNERNSNEK